MLSSSHGFHCSQRFVQGAGGWRRLYSSTQQLLSVHRPAVEMVVHLRACVQTDSSERDMSALWYEADYMYVVEAPA